VNYSWGGDQRRDRVRKGTVGEGAFRRGEDIQGKGGGRKGGDGSEGEQLVQRGDKRCFHEWPKSATEREVRSLQFLEWSRGRPGVIGEGPCLRVTVPIMRSE